MTSVGRFCGALLALSGTALYALPPAIIATGYLEHRELDRRAKMTAFEKLFERKRRLVLDSGFRRLKARAKNATRLLMKALRRQHAAEEEALRQAQARGQGVSPAGGADMDSSDLELMTAQRLYQQSHGGGGDAASSDGGSDSGSHLRRRSAKGTMPPFPMVSQTTRRTMGFSGRGGLVGEAAGAAASFRAPPAHVTSAAKALLMACRGDLSAGVRALCDAERWAASPGAAGDDSSLPDLVRLQTRTSRLG